MDAVADGGKSAEVAVEFGAGARGLNASVPWPKDEKGKKVDEIGRIGYRVGADIAATRILSIGTIAPNLLTLMLALESFASWGMDQLNPRISPEPTWRR